jgi:hypothetical protein
MLDVFTPSQLFNTDVIGCMDKNNLNYDPAATINDGDKCGGCIQGFTRIGESSFTCQEVGGKYIDCKTAEVFWKLKTKFSYRPPKESSNCAWWGHINKCHEIRVPAIGNDGVIYNTKHNAMNQPTLTQWENKRKDIESKCGSIAELPITPEEVPNYLPASSTPSVSYSQDVSAPMQTMSGQVSPVAPVEAEKKTNWILIGGVAVVAYFLLGSDGKQES